VTALSPTGFGLSAGEWPSRVTSNEEQVMEKIKFVAECAVGVGMLLATVALAGVALIVGGAAFAWIFEALSWMFPESC
jgi:hypothetical protein